MKTLWKTAYEAARLASQTGSDDRYYPSTEYRFSHGTRSQNRAINLALKLLDAKDDPMRFRKPGLILVKQRNRKRERASMWGPPTLHQFNCRCSAVALNESMLTLVGSFIEGSNSRARTMHGLVMENEFGHDPGVQTLVDRTSRLASTNEASKRYAEQKAELPDGAPRSFG